MTDRTLAELQKMTADRLTNIDGIGPIRAALINISLAEQENHIEQLIALFPAMINTADQKQEASRATVCFTGATPIKSETRDKLWGPLAAQYQPGRNYRPNRRGHFSASS